MSASKWMTERRTYQGRTMYQVYRLRDTKQPDEPENREYRGQPIPHQATAALFARTLNEVEL